MRYFTLFTSTTAPKNKLDAAAIEMLKTEASNRLIDSVSEFEVEIGLRLTKLNAQHPRCRPLQFYRYDRSEDTARYTLVGGPNITFAIHPVRETFTGLAAGA